MGTRVFVREGCDPMLKVPNREMNSPTRRRVRVRPGGGPRCLRSAHWVPAQRQDMVHAGIGVRSHNPAQLGAVEPTHVR